MSALRLWFGGRVFHFGVWLTRLGERIEGGEPIYAEHIDLEPEHALKALRDAQEHLGRGEQPE